MDNPSSRLLHQKPIFAAWGLGKQLDVNHPGNGSPSKSPNIPTRSTYHARLTNITSTNFSTQLFYHGFPYVEWLKPSGSNVPRNNMALCDLKRQEWARAVETTTEVLQRNGKNTKETRFRFGTTSCLVHVIFGKPGNKCIYIYRHVKT